MATKKRTKTGDQARGKRAAKSTKPTPSEAPAKKASAKKASAKKASAKKVRLKKAKAIVAAKAKAPKPEAKKVSKKKVSSKPAREKTLVEKLRDQGVLRAKIGGFDIDGVLRGKYVSLDKLDSALRKGFGFCDVIFGWDVADALYDKSKLTGWHTGYPDAHAVLDEATLRYIPWEPGVVSLIADFRDAEGKPHPACPRSLLKRTIARANKLGYEPRFGVEFEFFLFRETRDSLQEKHFHGLTPLDPGMFGYSWLRTGQDAELMADLLGSLEGFGIQVEGLHTETGPGVYEAALAATGALEAADQAALFKTAVKQVCHRHGLSASFMAKWSMKYPGCSGHIHQSLFKDGKNAFYDERTATTMSRLMRQYLAGQMELMQELTLMMSPTVNSYKRYVPGLWAPLVASWGMENRTCALRVIGRGSEKAMHIEHRQGAADLNPYVAISACLGAGLWGIEKGLTPVRPTQGDAGEDGELKLPDTLDKAIGAFQKSRAAKQLFGSEFVDHYAMTREWEARAYQHAVTDWELERYFETI